MFCPEMRGSLGHGVKEGRPHETNTLRDQAGCKKPLLGITGSEVVNTREGSKFGFPELKTALARAKPASRFSKTAKNIFQLQQPRWKNFTSRRKKLRRKPPTHVASVAPAQ